MFHSDAVPHVRKEIIIAPAPLFGGHSIAQQSLSISLMFERVSANETRFGGDESLTCVLSGPTVIQSGSGADLSCKMATSIQTNHNARGDDNIPASLLSSHGFVSEREYAENFQVN